MREVSKNSIVKLIVVFSIYKLWFKNYFLKLLIFSPPPHQISPNASGQWVRLHGLTSWVHCKIIHSRTSTGKQCVDADRAASLFLRWSKIYLQPYSWENSCILQNLINDVEIEASSWIPFLTLRMALMATWNYLKETACCCTF